MTIDKHDADLDMTVEIAPGVRRRLGECTDADLDGAMAVAQERRELHQRIINALERLRPDAGTKDSPLPAWLRSEEGTPDLFVLRDQAAEIEALT
jgi:hypothetical protein